MKKSYFNLHLNLENILKPSKAFNLLMMVLFVLLFSNNTNAQGNTCALATPLTINGACDGGSINDGTQNSPTISGCPAGTFRREGWYSFTVAGGPLNVTITGITTNRNLFLQLISTTSDCTGILSQIACANTDTNNNTAQTETITSLLGNGTYYVKVVNTGTSNGDMNLTSLCVTAVPTISSFTPSSGCVNTTLITITGTNFTGVTAVRFGGTNAASFTVNSSTQITATPAAGTTGTITVVTPAGTATSASSFTVNNLSTTPTGVIGTTAICNGNSTTLNTVGGTLGTGAIAEWFSSSCGGTSVGTGNSITVSPATTTTYFVRYNGTCNTTTCASITVTVTQPSVAPSSISGTTTICNGGSTTLTAVGGTIGTGANYQWGTGAVVGTSPIAGETASTLTISPTSSTTYWVRIENTTAPCTANTSGITQAVTVNAISAVGAVSADQIICSGSSPLSDITIASATGTIQWQSADNVGFTVGLTNIGTNSTTLTIAQVGTLTATKYFRAVVTSGVCPAATSSTVTVTVNQSSVAPTSISGTTTICNGGSTTLTAVGGTLGTGADYQWGTGAVVGTNPLAGQTASTLTISPSSTTTYWVRIENTSAPCTATTSAITQVVTVNPISAVGAVSANQTICSGSSPLSDITIASATGTIQWQSAGNVGFTVGLTNIGTNSTTLTIAQVGALTATKYFRAVVTSGVCPSATSSTVTVTVNQSSVAPTSISGTTTICNGGSTTLTAVGGTSGTGANYQWGTGAVVGTNPLAGQTASTLTISPSITTTYWVRIENTTAPCTATTSGITQVVTVNPISSVGAVSANQTICSGSSPSSDITIASATGSIQWQRADNAVFTIGLTNIGTNSTTLTIAQVGTLTATKYFRAVVTSGICSPTTSSTVTVNVTPTVGTPTAIAISAGVEPTCQLTNGTTTTTYSTTATNNTGFNWSLSNGAAGSINSSGVMTWTNGFSGTVNIQVTANGCNGPSSQVVRTVIITPTVGTPTAITISAGTQPTCQLTNGTTTTTYASTATNNTGFNWSLSNALAGSIGSTTGVMTWANGFSGTVNIQVTANGCNGPSSQIVRTVIITPTVGTPTAITISAGVEPTCQLTNGTTTTTYSTTATNNTGFNWSLSNGAAGSINSSGVMTWTNGFSGTVNIQVTANGCNGPSSQVIRTLTVNPLPNNTISTGFTGGSFCTGSQATLTFDADNTNGAPPYTLSYTDGTTMFTQNISTNGAETFNVSATTNTGYTLLSITNANGCVNLSPANNTANINFRPNPTATISGNTSVCQASASPNITFTNPLAAGITITYTINGGANQTINVVPNSTSTVAVPTTIAGTFVYALVSVVYTTSPSCIQTLTGSASVIVNPLPAAAGTITGPTPICQGQNGVVYTVPAIANATGYTWTLPSGATIVSGSGTNTIAVNFSMIATSGNITVIGTNACGSGVISANYPVTVNVTPSITINYSATVCSGELVTITPANGGGNIVPPGTTYSWGLPTITGGVTGATALSGQTSFTQTLVNPTNLTQTASYNVTATTGGCSASTFSVLVTVYPKPTVSGIPLTQSICSGAAFSAITLSNPNSIAGTIDYSWSRDNTTNVTGMSTTGTGSSITGNLSNTTSSPQTTVFTLIATTQNGCVSLPFNVSIVVNPIPTVAATPSSNQIICSENNIIPIALSNPNGITGVTYSWTRTNTINITGIPDGSGATISGNLTNTTNIAQTSVFTIKATANGCDSSTTTVTVIVNPKPTVAVSLATQTVCGGTAITPVIITNPNSVAGTTYSWTRDNTINLTGMLSGTGTPISGTLVNNTNIDQTTIFTVTATAGTCASTTTTTVIVKPTPTIAATPSSQTNCNAIAITTIAITNPNNVTSTTFTWTRNNTINLTGIAASGSGTSIAGTLTNTTTVTQTTTFTITATAGNSCISTSTASVTVYAPLVAPVIGDSQTACILATPDPLTIITPATGGSGTYSYQWERSTAATGQPWTIVGTASSYSPPQLPLIGAQNYFYRLIITDLCGTVTSNVVSIEPVINGSFTSSVSGYPAAAVCSGAAFSPSVTATLHLVSSAVRFTWSADPSFITPASGGPVGTTSSPTGFLNLFRTSTATLGPLTTINNTNATVTTTISVTPVVYDYPGPPTGAELCSVSSKTFNIIISPIPVATSTLPNTTICSGNTAGIIVTGNITDIGNTTTFNWSVNDNASVTGDNTTGSGSIGVGGSYTIVNTLTNTSLIAQSVTYTITPISNGCSGAPKTVTITIAPTVTAGTVIAAQTLCSSGDPAAFTQSVAAAGLNLTYQWESSTASATGPWTPIFGATATTYDAPSGLMVTTWYRRVVTGSLNGVFCSANSNSIQVTINSILPGTVAGTQTLCSPASSLTLTSVDLATGGGTITYQWESSTADCNSGFSNIASSGTSATYNIPAGLTMTTYYRRKAISTLNTIACTDYSNCITVNVNNVTAGSVGSDQTICGNNPDAFTVTTAATGSGALSYQWQSNTSGCSGSWGDIIGATVASYDAPPGLIVTTYYRRITTSTLNGLSCSAIGNCITVTANSVTAGAISGNRTVCSGGDPSAFTETTAATGTGITYQWQYSLVGGAGPWTNITGATSVTYDAPGPITQTTYFQRVVKASANGTDCYANSNFLVVFVNDITPSTIAGNQTLCSNLDPTAFTVPIAAIGTGTLTYQWQSNNTNCAGPWVNIPFATSATYDPPAISQTTYFQVVVTSTLNSVSCSATSNCITVISLSKSWNGSISTDWNTPTNWTPNGIPDATNCVVIPNVTNDPIIGTTNAVAYSLTVLSGGNLNIAEDKAVTITNFVNVNSGGTFQIENNGSLVQIDNVANTGNIIYKRTADNIKGYDYVYWSSPVSNQSIGSIYTTPTQGPKYQWDTLINNGNGASGNTGQGNWIGASGTMATAKGYIVRGSSNYGLAATNINSSFTGVPNNGNIPITIYRGAYTGVDYAGANGSTITKLSDNFNLLGNPYPSAISALQFLYDNSSVIEGNVDLWTHGSAPATGVTNPFYGSFAYNYASSYATINYTGSTIPPPPGIFETIKAGQAFFIKMKDGATSSAAVNFNNEMRAAIYSNSGFFKNENSNDASLIYENLERHRIWLDIVASNNSSDRALLGYVTGATLEEDHFFDAITVPSGNLDIYSLIDNQTFNIQGRPLPFNDNDIVPLGYKVGTSGSYHIAINTLDGLFETQNIYLEDLNLQITHDLKLAPYLFTSESGIFNNRFVIRYTNSALSAIDFESSNSVQVVVNEKVLIDSKVNNIQEIEVFDLLGRKIGHYKNVYEKEIILNKLRKTMTTLILKIKLDNDVIVTRKIIF